MLIIIVAENDVPVSDGSIAFGASLPPVTSEADWVRLLAAPLLGGGEFASINDVLKYAATETARQLSLEDGILEREIQFWLENEHQQTHLSVFPVDLKPRVFN